MSSNTGMLGVLSALSVYNISANSDFIGTVVHFSYEVSVYVSNYRGV